MADQESPSRRTTRWYGHEHYSSEQDGEERERLALAIAQRLASQRVDSMPTTVGPAHDLDSASHNEDAARSALPPHLLSLESMPESTESAIRSFAAALRKCGRQHGVILIVGREGIGKTSLLNHLVNEHVGVVRPWMGRAAATLPPRDVFGWLKHLARSVLTYAGYILPVVPSDFGIGVKRGSEVSVTRRSIDGVTLDFVDSPGVPNDGSTGELPALQRILYELGGVVNIMLYVTRLDDTRADRSEELTIKGVTSFLGHLIWRQAVVVFSHSASLPPDDLSYEQYVRGRRDRLWQAIADVIPDGATIHTRRRGEGPNDLSYTKMNAPEIALVETSPRCAKNECGQKMLPDGKAWLPELYEVMTEVIVETSRAIMLGEDELEEEPDEALEAWLKIEETLPIQTDTWYMEERLPDDAPPPFHFVRGGVATPPPITEDQMLKPLLLAVGGFLVCFLISSIVDTRTRSRIAQQERTYQAEERGQIQPQEKRRSLIITLDGMKELDEDDNTASSTPAEPSQENAELPSPNERAVNPESLDGKEAIASDPTSSPHRVEVPEAPLAPPAPNHAQQEKDESSSRRRTEGTAEEEGVSPAPETPSSSGDLPPTSEEGGRAHGPVFRLSPPQK